MSMSKVKRIQARLSHHMTRMRKQEHLIIAGKSNGKEAEVVKEPISSKRSPNWIIMRIIQATIMRTAAGRWCLKYPAIMFSVPFTVSSPVALIRRCGYTKQRVNTICPMLSRPVPVLLAVTEAVSAFYSYLNMPRRGKRPCWWDNIALRLDKKSWCDGVAMGIRCFVGASLNYLTPYTHPVD